MARARFILVSDDRELIENTRAFGQNQGVTVEIYTPSEWENRQGGNSSPTMGISQGQSGAKILPFPGGSATQGSVPAGAGGVQTINELESVAIERAIFEFKGNLTEAAKALGIGRATLYRKVKQYNLDPSKARKRRAA